MGLLKSRLVGLPDMWFLARFPLLRLALYRICALVIRRVAAATTLKEKEVQKKSHSQTSTAVPLKDQLIFLSACSK